MANLIRNDQDACARTVRQIISTSRLQAVGLNPNQWGGGGGGGIMAPL